MGDWIVRNIPASSMFVLPGLILLGLAYYRWWSERRCTAQTAGVVKDINRNVGGSKKSSSSVLFAYSVGDVEYVRNLNYGSSNLKFSVGDSVTIFYDPSKPRRFYALEEGGKRTYKDVFFMVGFGVVLLLITVFAESN